MTIGTDDDSALVCGLSDLESFVFYRLIPFGLALLFVVASNICVYDAATKNNLGYWWIVMAADVAALVAFYMFVQGDKINEPDVP